jgi:prolyl oligopeptidase
MIAAISAAALLSAQTLTYPTTRKGDQVDTYHAVKVADPYRWLEDDNSAETAAWVEAQNKVTMPYLERIPYRPQLAARVKQLSNYERYSSPSHKGPYYFFSKNNGLQNQSVLYVAESADADGRVLLDPNTLSEDGTVALSGSSLSEDGTLLAYGLSSSGSDWMEWRVRDIATGIDRADHLKWIKFSGAAWIHDGSGFYYSRYNEPPAGMGAGSRRLRTNPCRFANLSIRLRRLRDRRFY